MTFPPPLPPPPALTAARVASRTVGIVVLAVTLLGGVLLLPVSMATGMQLGSCVEGTDAAPGCTSAFLGLLGFALPWIGWLLGVFGALALFVAAWRRRRREWLGAPGGAG
ncbi:hypothetical protein, partial [Thermobifida halotolerans]|uniref:hypothetical protein n=1 Tax=Thermobifida halotolerans TaxID=483545 RepID=UPI0018FE9BAA